MANALIIIGCLIALFCLVGFYKSNNIFLSVKMVFICNTYGISLLLIGFALQRLSILLMIKALILISLNIIITIILNHIIIKKVAGDQKIIK
jgi:multisubunit Na+/H+ antiporter MnhG subunit